MKFEKFYADCTNAWIEATIDGTNVNDRSSIANTLDSIRLEIKSQLDRADHKVDFESLAKLNTLYQSYSILINK